MNFNFAKQKVNLIIIIPTTSFRNALRKSLKALDSIKHYLCHLTIKYSNKDNTMFYNHLPEFVISFAWQISVNLVPESDFLFYFLRNPLFPEVSGLDTDLEA